MEEDEVPAEKRIESQATQTLAANVSNIDSFEAYRHGLDISYHFSAQEIMLAVARIVATSPDPPSRLWCRWQVVIQGSLYRSTVHQE